MRKDTKIWMEMHCEKVMWVEKVRERDMAYGWGPGEHR